MHISLRMANKRKSFWRYSRCKILVQQLRSKAWYVNSSRAAQIATWRALVVNPYSVPSKAWQIAWLGVYFPK